MQQLQSGKQDESPDRGRTGDLQGKVGRTCRQMREKYSNGPLREDETSKADCLNVNQLNEWKLLEGLPQRNVSYPGGLHDVNPREAPLPQVPQVS